MTTPEGLTNEERAAYWRELRMKPFQDDPEMLEIIRQAKFDFEVPWESTPEETRRRHPHCPRAHREVEWQVALTGRGAARPG